MGTCKWLSFLLPDLRKGKCFERTIPQVPRKKERVSTIERPKQSRCIEVSPGSSCSRALEKVMVASQGCGHP